jgi:plasmid replication initiation protein
MTNSKSILYKHIGAVHQSSPLTIVQRKVMNLFLLYAAKDLGSSDLHKIPLKQLKLGLGWSENSKTPEHLVDSLKDLVTTRIEWNILKKDKKSSWVASSMLASVGISDGVVSYSFSAHLRQLFAHKNIYAKLDMDTQKKLKSQGALVIWEYVMGVLSSEKVSSSVTDWVNYLTFLQLTGHEGTIYETRFALYRSKILEKAISEINEKTELTIAYETLVEKRQVSKIRFIVSRKTPALMEEIQHPLEKLGFPKGVVEEITGEFSSSDISDAIDYMKKYKDRSQIENPVAFFRKAIKEGWGRSEAILEELDNIDQLAGEDMLEKVHCKIRDDLEQSSIPDQEKKIRLAWINQFGETLYLSWLQKCKVVISNDEIELLFERRLDLDFVETRYHHDIRAIIQAINPDIRSISYSLYYDMI